MNDDDLERTLRDSLERHASGVARPAGHIDEVYARVERRRARHRSYAVVGSLAIVGVGVVGIAALAANDASGPAANEGALGGDVVPTTIGALGQSPSAWSCAGYLGSDGSGRELYADCYPTVVGDPRTGVCATTTTMTTTTTTVPMSSEPPTTTGVAVEAPADCGPATDLSWVGPACPDLPPTTTTPSDAAVAVGPPADCGPVVDPACLGLLPTTTAPFDLPVAGTAPPVNMCAPVMAVTSTTSTIALAPMDDCQSQSGMATTTTSITMDAPDTTSPVEQRYVVVPGDSLYSIAARFGIAPEIIANYNVWSDCMNHLLLVGDLVMIPPGAIVPAG